MSLLGGLRNVLPTVQIFLSEILCIDFLLLKLSDNPASRSNCSSLGKIKRRRTDSKNLRKRMGQMWRMHPKIWWTREATACLVCEQTEGDRRSHCKRSYMFWGGISRRLETAVCNNNGMKRLTRIQELLGLGMGTMVTILRKLGIEYVQWKHNIRV